MATRNNSTKGAGRGAKPVIDHDPLANTEEDAVPENEVAAEAKPSPAKKTVKKKAVAKKATEAVVETPEVAEAPATDDFVLGESLTIVEVADSHQRLMERLAAGGSVSLDGGSVEGVDGAGLQLLAVFMKDAKAQGVEVSWSDISDALKVAVNQVGLTEALGVGGGD